MNILQSYVRGHWQAPAEAGRPIHDAVSGDEVTRISSAGIDMAATLEYGRVTGGPSLRELTFHQRADLLDALAGHLRGHREELYALSARAGSTLFDARFDVDGGLGVVKSYAAMARKELPNETYYLEGAAEPLGRRKGTFLGTHLCVPLRGVAVQVNAYNFPVWGPLEKLTQAIIGGVPSVIKPASQTAYLTARLVELIVESGILPAGAIQLVCGSVGDMFDHLTEQDLVSFTGSAATAVRIRNHPVISARSVRFNAEADSLNCSILGPDAAPGTPEFDLYVTQLVEEMTVKAGQKCTAIRRALVPADAIDAVLDSAHERLSAITIGNPADPNVQMGALAGLEQREEVRRSVKSLQAAGRVVFGDPERVDLVDADAERGAFMPPVLLHCADIDRPEPHEIEAFGPVSTVLPYDSVEQVAQLAARGQGSLAASVVTGDTAIAKQLILGLAPWHGRILVLNQHNSAESTGHGSPLPSLIHGGPGRAGGGEEMGGIRGVLHHLNRAAVQVDPAVLGALAPADSATP